MSSVSASVAVPLFSAYGTPLPCQRLVFFGRERGGGGCGDVDRRGNNNENTIKSRLHRSNPP